MAELYHKYGGMAFPEPAFRTLLASTNVLASHAPITRAPYPADLCRPAGPVQMRVAMSEMQKMS